MSRRLLLGASGVAAFLILAELAGRLGDFPRASEVLVAAARLAVDGAFLADVGATLTACLTGLLIAIAVAVPVGLLLGTVPVVERSVRPLVEFLRPIPSLSLIPLAMFLWTDSQDAKTALIVYTCSWPLLINTMYGLGDVDPLAKDSMRAFGFGPFSVLMRVSLPSTAPFIVTGVRIAVSVTLIVAVSVELIAGGSGGLGTFLVEAGSANRRELVLAGTLWAGVIGVVANMLFTAAERRLFRWHHVRNAE